MIVHDTDHMLQCVAVCCSVLQCVAVCWMCCSVLQCVAGDFCIRTYKIRFTCKNKTQMCTHVNTHICVLQNVAVGCYVMQMFLVYANTRYDLHANTRRRCAHMLQRVSVCCNVWQCVAVCCRVLQCVADVFLDADVHTCKYTHTKMYTQMIIEVTDVYTDTGWRRLIGCPALLIIFRKRATKYRAVLRNMT